MMTSSKWNMPDISEKIKKATAWYKDTLTHYLHELQLLRNKSKDIPETNYQLGVSHFHRGNLYDAKMRLRMVLYFRPQHIMAHYYLGRVYYRQGQKEKSILHFEQSLRLNPNLAEAWFYLGVLGRKKSPTLIPSSLIEEYYAQKASTFIAEKKADEYNIPKLITQLFSSMPHSVTRMLEYGCAAGLIAQELHAIYPDLAITAVDRSAALLAEAKKYTNAYTEVFCGDIASFKPTNTEPYQVILANWSLHTTADLTSSFKQLHAMLAPNGWLIIYIAASQDESKSVTLAESSMHFCFPEEVLTEQLRMAALTPSKMQRINISSSQLGWEIVLQKGEKK